MQNHLEVIYKILIYFQGSSYIGLFFKKNELKDLDIFIDANWAGLVEDMRPTIGYCTLVFGKLVSWRSKKQNVVVRSSAKVEFRAIAQRICETLWLRKLLMELQVSIKPSTKLIFDNKTAINISHNHVQHDKTKHVKINISKISKIKLKME